MIRSFAAATAFVITSVFPAHAQQAAPGAEELLALNFYMQQKDTQSVNAELRRLQLKYPQWIPPEDLSRIGVTVPSTEIDTFYRLVADGKFTQARETLARAKKDYPEWKPPAEMTDLLEIAEGQVLLNTAFDEDNLVNALQIVAGAPGLLRCDRINNAWRLADAQRSAGLDGEALGTYRAVLAACIVQPDIVTTLEKVDAIASEPELRSLFAQVMSRFPAQEEVYSQLLQRLLAGRGSAGSAAAGTTKSAKRAERSATASQPATASAEPEDTSAAKAPSPQKAPPKSAPAPRPSKNSLDALVSAGDWAGCLQRAAGSHVASVVYQSGWCAYNLERPMEAITAFRTALSGKLDATQRQDATYGIALAYLKMNMTEEAARISASSNFTRKQRIDIERQILNQRGVLAYKNRQYRQAIQYFDALEQISGGIQRDLEILRAYSYLNAGDRDRARTEFLRLNKQMSTRDSRAGLAASTE